MFEFINNISLSYFGKPEDKFLIIEIYCKKFKFFSHLLHLLKIILWTIYHQKGQHWLLFNTLTLNFLFKRTSSLRQLNKFLNILWTRKWLWFYCVTRHTKCFYCELLVRKIFTHLYVVYFDQVQVLCTPLAGLNHLFWHLNKFFCLFHDRKILVCFVTISCKTNYRFNTNK